MVDLDKSGQCAISTSSRRCHTLLTYLLSTCYLLTYVLTYLLRCDKHELKTMLNAMFTLNIPDHVMEELVQLADIDGDGAIRYAEFARVFSADDIRHMKKTLRASGGGSDYVDGRKPITHE